MPESPDLDRRPIASRDLPVFQRMSARLAAAGASPNAISFFGMIAGIAAGSAFAAVGGDSLASRALLLLAASMVQIRLLCNLLDGMVAVARGVQSKVGELWNEIPDRVSDAVILIGAGYAAGSNVALGFVAACVALFVAYVRAAGKGAGAKNDFCGPMAKSHRMATMTAAALLAAVMPNFRVSLPLSGAVSWVGLALWVVVVLGALTAARRIARIAHALRSTP